MQETLKTLKDQLHQLRDLHNAGALPKDQYDSARIPLERRLIDLVMDQPPTEKKSLPLLLGVIGFILFIAAVGYWWAGTPALLANGSNASSSSSSDSGTTPPHSTDLDQISTMVDSLAERLKSDPGNTDGWAMLARSYTVLERHADALKAYKMAVSSTTQDADLLADYADALALNNGRQLSGEPMAWVERALKIDPRNLKALALAGTHAWDKKNYAAAANYWQRLVDAGSPENPLVQQIKPGLASAREKAGMPTNTNNSKAPSQPSALSGTISLAPGIGDLTKPSDTVFIFARNETGARMPLAILRKQVRDLPFQFTLDDSMAMSPAAKLSDAKLVVVEARVSKSGEARPQPGDLRGETPPVKPGTTSLTVVIKDIVKP